MWYIFVSSRMYTIALDRQKGRSIQQFRRDWFMRRITLITLALAIMLTVLPAPRAEAFVDPVTIAILAPIALKAAEVAKPYVIRGLMSGGKHMLSMGGDILELLLLPLGILQMVILWPFGQLAPGMKNTFVGLIAPFKLAFRALFLPVAFFGIGINN